METKEIVRQLEYILKNVEKAYNRTEGLSKKIDVPSHAELGFIKLQIEQLIEMGKEKIK